MPTVPRGRLNQRDIWLGVVTVAFMVGILLYSLMGGGSGRGLEVDSCVGRGIDYARSHADGPGPGGQAAEITGATEARVRARCTADPGAF